MIKATPELEAKIKASGIPIIKITLEQLFKNTKPATEEQIQQLYELSNIRMDI